jgi:hypothetical protein
MRPRLNSYDELLRITTLAVQYYQLRLIICGIRARNLPGVGVLGQRTAVAMVRQLVESRPDFLTNPKEVPHGKASEEREDYE